MNEETSLLEDSHQKTEEKNVSNDEENRHRSRNNPPTRNAFIFRVITAHGWNQRQQKERLIVK